MTCFEEKCFSLEAFCLEKSPRFLKYFRDRLKEQLSLKVIQPVKDSKIPYPWTNNNSESINHVLKQAIEWKSRPITDLVKRMHDLVSRQFTDLRGAIFGTGECRLAKTHEKFKQTKTEWMTKTDEQKTKHYSNFRRFKIDDPKFITSTDGLNKIVAPKSVGRKPAQRKRKINERTRTITPKREKKDECIL